MSDRFEKILKFDDNFWCSSSPVLIEKGALLKDTYTNKLVIQLRFMNIVSKPVLGLNLRIVYYNKFNNISGKLDFSYTDFNAGKGECFGDRIPIYIPDFNAREFNFIITKVIFKDHTQWDNDVLFSQVPKENTDINTLGELKEQFIRDIREIYKKENKAITTKIEHLPVFKSNYWFCTCGAFNTAEEDTCCKCGINKKSQIEAIKIDNLKENKNKYDIEFQKETKRINEVKKRNFKKFIIAVISIAIIIILLLIGKGAVTAIRRSNNYNKAVELYNKKEYQEAYNLFTMLGDYKDSNNYSDDILYLWDGIWYNEDNPENNMTIKIGEKENEIFADINFSERYGKTIQVNCEKRINIDKNDIYLLETSDNKNFYNIKMNLDVTNELVVVEIKNSIVIKDSMNQTYIYRKEK